MSAAFLHERRVPVQVQRPALGPVHAVSNRFPPGTVPVDMPVLQLHPRAGWRLGVEPHLDLAGLGLVSLDRPPRADIPAEHHAGRRVKGQDPRPPAFAAVRCPVHNAAAHPRLEHSLGYRRPEHVVLWWLEVPELISKHRESTLDRRVNNDVLTDCRCVGLSHQASLYPYRTPLRPRRTRPAPAANTCQADP